MNSLIYQPYRRKFQFETKVNGLGHGPFRLGNFISSHSLCVIFLAAVIFLPTVLFVTEQSFAGSYSFINIVDTNSPAPAGQFTYFQNVAFDGRSIAYTGFYNHDNDVGVFSSNGQVTTTIAAGTLSPAFGQFFASDQTPVIDGATVAFSGRFTNAAGIFTSNGGALATVAIFGGDAPSGKFSVLGDLAISGDTITFDSALEHGNGLYISSGGQLTEIAHSDITPIPGGPDAFGNTKKFWQFYDVSINKGVVAFNAYFDNGNGVFTWSGWQITTIAKTGELAPTGGEFRDFENSSISRGKVAFLAGDTNDVQGVYVGTGGPVQLIAKEGDTAPVGTFTDFDEPTISGDTVAFEGTYGSNLNGIFANNGGVLDTVIKQGDPLFGSTVTAANITSFCLDPNGSGQIAFLYELGSGRRGIAIAVPIPEPANAALGGLALVALVPQIARCRIRSREIKVRRSDSLNRFTSWVYKNRQDNRLPFSPT